ncbi:glycosyl transferase family 17, partial [Pelagibacterales bacterium SAG-MED12]|nr:glycosyl transferase family 17 [Pelagibacterales bacterium SAG-MED12]
MSKKKIIDCITFFDNNFIFDLRYHILKNYVDFFVICESKYDHRNNKKKLNFDKNNYNAEKIRYIVLEEPFPGNKNLWENQAIQREYILANLDFALQD